MTKILEAKGGKLTVIDALMIAGAKSVSERLLSKIIGNGSLMSGAIKLAGAIGLVSGVKGKVGDIFGTALMVDGAEDIITSFMGGAITGIGGGAGIQAKSNVQIL